MIRVIAVHLMGADSLRHIATLRWVQVDEPGGVARAQPQDATRASMVDFVNNNPNQTFAMNSAGTHYAYLEVVNATPPYVKTVPDGTISDNLLSLPRF